MTVRISLLDVGKREYGDSILCQLGDRTILIDGAHPGDENGGDGHASIPAQLSLLLEQAQPPFKVDLLIVTHAHNDHIGCLPALVRQGVLQAGHALVADPDLGFGHTEGTPSPVDAPGVGRRLRGLVAALREEILSPAASNDAVSALVADAVTLEDRYTTMLDSLQAAGTVVVRHGRDDPSDLIRAFDDMGFDILGPSQTQLERCRDEIARAITDLMTMGDALFTEDAGRSLADAYFMLTRGDRFADAVSQNRPGDAINMQSVVSAFEAEGVKLLLAGDLQWVRNQLHNSVIDDEVHTLRERVRQAGPFSFVKLSHHGSDNGFDPRLLSEMAGTNYFGISAGEDSTAHPNPAVLELLNTTPGITWARTDHNRRSTFTFSGTGAAVEVERPPLNDPVPNQVDAPAPPAASPSTEPGPANSGADTVEVLTRIPHVSTRVSFAIEVSPGSAPVGPDGAVPPAARPDDSIQLAGGRALTGLLFATNAARLAENIGSAEADAVLDAIRRAGTALVDDVPSGRDRIHDAVGRVKDAAGQVARLRGIVLLGGYDVIPSATLDCLPSSLRGALTPSADADDFVVWTDDLFGDLQGSSIPSVPVSRIPDARSADLIRAAIQASDTPRPGTARQGVRNTKRPFADAVYADIDPSGRMVTSIPEQFDTLPPLRLASDWVYLMLHGDFDDSGRFWGEDNDGGYPVAVATSSVSSPGPRVIFSGCCWGALTVDRRASRADPLIPLAPKTPQASVALTFLLQGAIAFIGCTGSHYSPMENAPSHAGGPLHQAFWRALSNVGTSPAQALLDAKLAYLADMPHGRRGASDRAIEFKTLRQFTCLGLGW